MLPDLFIGAAAALATIWILKQFPPWIEYTGYCVGLILAAFIYVAFAMWGGEQPWLMIEAVGVVIYGLAAVGGLLLSSWFVALGWLAHVLWDVGLHLGGTPEAFVPQWYPVACLTYDVIVGVYVIRQREKWFAAGLPRPGWNKLFMKSGGIPDRS